MHLSFIWFTDEKVAAQKNSQNDRLYADAAKSMSEL